MRTVLNRLFTFFVVLAIFSALPLFPVAEAKAPSKSTVGVRLQLPQFTFIAGMHGEYVFGTEQALQLEIFNHHVIQFGFVWGKNGDLGFIGGGLGYAYSWEFLRGLMRFDLGALAGFFAFTIEDAGGGWDMFEFMFILLQPTFHVGCRYIYFSIGPRMFVGSAVAGGFVAGLTLRFAGPTN